MEMAESGPMPGSTPIRLPTNTPTNDQMKLCGSNATPKPCHKAARDCPIMRHPHVNNGNCTCNAHQNTTTQTIDIATASSSAFNHELSRSPSAEINTTAKVAGRRPPYFPSTTNATTLPRMQNQPRHSNDSFS